MLATKNISFKNIIEVLIIIFPISLLFSNILSELIIFFLILLFLKLSNFNYFLKNLKEPLILSLVVIWLYLIANYFFNFEKNPSLQRSFFFIRFPLLILSISFFVNELNINLKKIYRYYFVIILVVCFDLFFQFFNNFNLLGYKSILQGKIYRLGGFMDTELKISNIIFHFGALSISYFLMSEYLAKYRIKIIMYVFFLIISIFITAERSNFVNIFLFSFVLIIFLGLKYKKIFLLALSFFIIFFSGLFFSNSELSNRMFKSLLTVEIANLNFTVGKNLLFQDSHYFAHYSTAYQIYDQNKYFGVGLKNFRNYCDNENFNSKIHPAWVKKKCSTHPHNYYFEILSELGIVGFFIINSFFIFSFYSFLNFYFKTHNNYLLFTSLILMIYFIPFLPRGSFFTNWNAMIFWMVYSFAFSNFIKLKSKFLK